jgi:hypothetical protein
MIKDLIMKAFNEWMDGPLQIYKFGEKDLYSGIDKNNVWHASNNPFIKTEADIQIKFGGYLEQFLMRVSPTYTVHAELNAYPTDRKWWADLSVHDVSSGGLWLTEDPDPVLETTRAIVEIKYSNFRDPDWPFNKGYIQSDLKKLATLPAEIDRFFLILDETNSISDQNINELLTDAKLKGANILSNNQKLFNLQ